jgi:hypothetical protein
MVIEAMRNAAAANGLADNRDEYQEHVITALAGLSEPGKSLLGSGQLALLKYAPESKPSAESANDVSHVAGCVGAA